MTRIFPPTVYQTLVGRIVKETEKAILFSVVDKETLKTIKQEWFPKSQISSFGGIYDEIDGTFQYILASEWIIKEKGLINNTDKNIGAISSKPSSLTPTPKPAIVSTVRNVQARREDKADEHQPEWEDPNDMQSLMNTDPSPIDWDKYMSELSDADKDKE